MRSLTYFVAASLDGFIADADGGFDMFPVVGDHIDYIVDEFTDTLPRPAQQALGVTADRSRFDAVLMGWHTYDVGASVGLTSPYPHLDQYVFSRAERAVPDDVTLVPGDPVATVRELKSRDGAGIWLCGGGNLAAQLIDEIDELIVKTNPVALGGGIGLFGELTAPTAFVHDTSRAFASGVVVSRYTTAR